LLIPAAAIPQVSMVHTPDPIAALTRKITQINIVTTLAAGHIPVFELGSFLDFTGEPWVGLKFTGDNFSVGDFLL
jgi:hypothetical protein